MHELSLAQEICRIIREKLGEAGCGLVREVGLEVGERAGVAPDSLAFCLELLLAEPPFEGAHCRLNRVPGSDLALTYVEVADGDSADRGQGESPGAQQ